MRRFLGVLVAAMLGGSLAVAAAAPAGAAPAATRAAADQVGSIVAKHNGQCLMSLSWTRWEQAVTRGCDGSAYQRWTFQSLGGDLYRIVNHYNDMCLDVLGSSSADWTNVVTAPCSGTTNQQWRRSSTFDGYFELIATHSSKCLDISWGWAVQYGCTNGDNERFRIR